MDAEAETPTWPGAWEKGKGEYGQEEVGLARASTQAAEEAGHQQPRWTEAT